MTITTFKDRLKDVVGEGRNVSAFAKKCGFTEGVLRQYLAGKSLPGLDKLVKIAVVGEVSLDWLAMGMKQDVITTNYDREITKVSEQQPPKFQSSTINEIIRISGTLDNNDLESVLKYAEEKKLLAELKAERQTKKAG